MKQLIFIFCFYSTIPLGFSQVSNLATLKGKIWDNEDHQQQAINFSEKWNNESAVILYRELGYYYFEKASDLDFHQVIRQRIKLLDKSAVEAYSEFSIDESLHVSKDFFAKRGRAFAAFKVIKPDGKENIIDLNNAVRIKGKEGTFLKKIAIPDLEVGDILDYFYYTFEFVQANKLYSFQPIIASIQSRYPIVEQQIIFQVDKHFHIRFNSYNNAPELILDSTSNQNSLFTPTKKSLTYTLRDKDREKAADVNWLYERRALPFIKSQVIFASNPTSKILLANDYLEEDRKLKKRLYENEILQFVQPTFTSPTAILGLVKHLKKKGLHRVEGKEMEMLKEAYSFERYHHLISKIEYESYGIGKETFKKSSLGRDYTDYHFIRTFSQLLLNQRIDFEIVALIPRNLGTLSQLLLREELRVVIKVNLDKPYYLAPFHLYSTPGSLPENFEGAEAYTFQFLDLYQFIFLRKITLPESSYEENNSFSSIQLVISPSIETFSASRLTKQIGHNKTPIQPLAIKPLDFMKEDFEYFGIMLQKDYDDKKHNSQEYRDKLQSIFEEEKRKQYENLKGIVEKEYQISVSNYQEPKILSLGRTLENPALIYNEEFEMEGLVKQAGQNYLLEITKLIGTQVALENKEITRTYDVYYDYARSYDNEITLEIPEGYTVTGLEKLQKKVENEMGHFISTATVEGTTLKIKTFKAYKTNFITVEAWPKAVAFLEAAFQFTQEKVLLKKS